MQGIVARDCAKPRNDHLCGCNQQGSCAYADRNTAELVSIQGGPVSERGKFSQNACGVSAAKEKVLGAAFVGERLLGGFKRKRDR